jgi:predicted MPP superfamily phosphohydrolase
VLHGSLDKTGVKMGEGEVQTAQGAGWFARYFRPRRGPWLQLWGLQGFEWNRLDLSIAGLPAALEGTRLLHITDLHLRSTWPRGLDALVERVKGDPPDVILFGGDQAHNMHHLEPSRPQVQRLVKELPSQDGSYAVLGNHDGDLMGPILGRWGVHLIAHERVEISINGEPLELIGFPGPARRDFDDVWIEHIPPRRANIPRIVLSHYPDLIRHAGDLKPDLFLAGHTHGGQICLPGEIPIIRHDSLPRRYCKGVHEYRGMCLSVSRGMGFSSAFQVRVFCPCEVLDVVLGKLET